MREQLIKEVEIIPLEVVVRNIAAGSLSQRLGIAEGDCGGVGILGQGAIDRAHIMVGREGRQQLPADTTPRANQADIHRAVPFWI